MRRATATVLTAATALLLAACTGGGDAPSTPTTAGATTQSPGATAAPTTGDDEPVAGDAVQDCLLGTWRLDLAAMQDDLRGLLTAAGNDQDAVEVVVGGSSTYEFAAGGRFGATVDSTSSMTIAADGAELSSSSRSAGDLTGTWSLTDDQLTISDVDTSGLRVTTTGTLDGEELDVPDGAAEDAIEALPPTVSTATCSPSTLTLVSTLQADESSEPTTLTYTLRR
ncbi:hypothetical protein J1G44_01695 [Cellulomonas sp. zg-ZUI199]|uniref:Lipocalin-like domain-containing protein n=1 Tax=Cellulomonas wangleii TaxID=2816956 RepID=A0ABX8D269_9CELL|nr:hypothetical protein [Cellulomonas wangleii]MBO0923195.1 hypothetical protein [Cellulomonas wangleii]QVI61568.1 hypothetical protein KG103_13980 [Cellulomonas wangleii]